MTKTQKPPLSDGAAGPAGRGTGHGMRAQITEYMWRSLS